MAPLLDLRRVAFVAVGGLLLAVFAASTLTGCAADRRRAMETRRTTAFDLFNEGERYERAGNYEAALSRYRDALDLSERPAFFYKVGRMHHELGDPERALLYYDQALAMSPDYELANAHRDLARLELREDELTTRTQTPAVPPAVSREEAQTRTVAPPPAAPTPAPAEPVVASPAPGSPSVDSVEPAAPVGSVVAEAPAPTLAPTPAPTVTPAPVVERQIAAPVAPDPAPAARATTTTPAAPRAPAERPRVAALGQERVDMVAMRGAVFPELSAETRDDVDGLRASARTATEQGRWSDASLEWSRVVGREPANTEARLELARAFMETGRTRRGLEEFRLAASQAPENAEVFLRWGNALVRVDRPGEAETRFRQAIAIEPRNVRALNNLGAVTLSQERYAESLDALGRLLEIEPEYAPAHLNRALALAAGGGSSAEAINHLETYLRLGGERQAEAERWLVRLRSGQR